jgi:hypothetical protein
MSKEEKSPALDDAVSGIVITHSLEELPKIIRDDLGKSVQGFIDAGRHLAEARKLCGWYTGEWAPWVLANLPFGKRTADRLIAIALDPVLGELDEDGVATHVSQLPPSWGTLYALTLCKDKASLKAAIESGKIGPGTEREEAREWVAETNDALAPLAPLSAPGKKAKAEPGDYQEPELTPEQEAAWTAQADAQDSLAAGLAQAHPAVIEPPGVMTYESMLKNPPEVWEVVRDAMNKLPAGQQFLLAKWLAADPGWSALLASLSGPDAGTVDVGGAHGTLADVAEAIAILTAPGATAGHAGLGNVLKGNPFAKVVDKLARQQWKQKWPGEQPPAGGKQLVLAYLEKLAAEHGQVAPGMNG